MKSLRVSVTFALTAFVLWSCLAEEKDPWESFHLKTAKLNGVTLHYDESFASKLGSFRTSFQKFLEPEGEEAKRVQELLERENEIIEEVNHILGLSASDEQRAQHQQFLAAFLRPRFRFREPRAKINVYLVKQGTVKDYLRKGGSLPNFSYDRASDKAYCKFFVPASDPAPEEGITFALPVSDVDALETEVKDFFESISQLGGQPEGAAFHELFEWTLVNQRLRPYDPYFRWFSDGFADAVTVRLLRKYVSEDAAKRYPRDPQRYSDLEKEINLYYWMGPDFSIGTSLESEDRLENARYAYAAFEAGRLIDKCGIECVAKILDKACKERRNDSRNLVAAVKEVAGEDIEQRFRRYQTFETKEEGIKKYTTAFNAAMGRRDYSEALVNLLRVQELRSPALQDYASAAFLLFRLGNEEMGDRAIEKHMALLKSRGLDEPLRLMQKLFVEYALKCRNPAKARQDAEDILKREPDFVPALAVRMENLGASGDIPAAKEVARRILELERHTNSPAYSRAKAALSVEEIK